MPIELRKVKGSRLTLVQNRRVLRFLKRKPSGDGNDSSELARWMVYRSSEIGFTPPFDRVGMAEFWSMYFAQHYCRSGLKVNQTHIGLIPVPKGSELPGEVLIVWFGVQSHRGDWGVSPVGGTVWQKFLRDFGREQDRQLLSVMEAHQGGRLSLRLKRPLIYLLEHRIRAQREGN